jgi:hypothetical protein
MADYRRTVFRKHRTDSRFLGQNRRWWSVHNIYGCTYSSFARWMGNELVWRKEGGRDRVFRNAPRAALDSRR